MRNSLKVMSLFLALALTAVVAKAESVASLSKKAQRAATILETAVSMPDRAIPNSLLERAVCVATVPNVMKIGFVFGARYGKGLVSCRTAEGWSRPSFVQLRGGSWGWQIGLQSIDLILVFVQPSAVERFSKNNFTVGVDATVAAGPLGRDAQAGTDYKLDSEIYSYSRARGLFAGLMIQGTSIAVDTKDNAQIYGSGSALSLLTADGRTSPATVLPYVDGLEKFAH